MTIQTIQPAIQSFVSADTVSIYPYQSAPDFNNDRIFVYSRGGLLCRFAISTGVQFAFSTLISQSPGGAAPYSACVDSQGYLYMPYDLSNFTGVSKINPDTLEIFTFFGVSSSMDNSPNGVPGVPLFCSPSAGAIPFVYGLSSIAVGSDALSGYVMGNGPTFGGGLFSIGGIGGAGANGSICAAQVGTTGVAFSLLAKNFTSDNELILNTTIITRQAALYDPTAWPTPNPGLTNSNIGTIACTAVDPTWLYIGQNGILCDEMDGNVIAVVFGQDASGHVKTYIVKINSETCAVMWKIEVVGSTDDINCFGFSSIKHGRLAYLLDSAVPHVHEILFIDTATGDNFTSTVGINGVGALGAQYFNDTLGAIFAYVTFTHGSDSPILLNDTPETFTGWAALYVMDRFSPPFTPGGRQVYTKIWGAPAGV